MINLPPKKVRLNDGTELEVNWCGAAEGVLWVDGLHIDMARAFSIFSDHTKTSTIIAPYDEVHVGYTNLINVSESTVDTVRVALRKEK